jgi:hypothetical protein
MMDRKTKRTFQEQPTFRAPGPALKRVHEPASFITQFAAGFQNTTLQMYKWLLYPVLNASTEKLEEGMRYREMRDTLRELADLPEI